MSVLISFFFDNLHGQLRYSLYKMLKTTSRIRSHINVYCIYLIHEKYSTVISKRCMSKALFFLLKMIVFSFQDDVIIKIQKLTETKKKRCNQKTLFSLPLVVFVLYARNFSREGRVNIVGEFCKKAIFINDLIVIKRESVK